MAKHQRLGNSGEADLPWQFYVIAASIAYVVLNIVVPNTVCTPSRPCASFVEPAVGVARRYGDLVAGMLLMPAPVVAYRCWRRRRLLDNSTSIEHIRMLDWRQFEHLVAEFYRRQGHRVAGHQQSGADGGVDVWVRKRRGGGLYLVQCKHWRDTRINASAARELYGVIAAEGAQGGALIATAGFTRDAVAFARGKPLDLIHGPALVRMIAAVRAGDPVPPTTP